MFKRILVPLDGSGRAERALPIAARLARATGGSIFLVRVLSTEPARLPSAPGKPNLVQTIGQADRALAESYLAGVAESELLTGIPVQTYVPVGLISPSILTMAAEKHADIIVMCSHGYTGVKRWWMMGSVAAKVARFADIPVLVLREGGSVPEERHPGERPLRVLVPLDGSDYARAALVPAAYLAAALAAPGRGALHLTHIVQPTNEGKAARATQNTQALLNMAKEYLEATIHYLREGSLDPGIVNLNLEFTSSVIVDDEIAQGILRVAEDGGNGEGVGVFGGCDAIAMTTQGYSGLQRWVGSVTERVLDTSRLPLLIVRPRE
ncbi:MAG: universal stress protein [Chloroflexi bacterium]|nr:MAG: universal stress protein [Chloroflexota bacterium]